MYIGRNSNAEGGEVKVGPWVMAQSEDGINSAKAWLDRSNIVFRSDVEVDGIRRKYHSYHLTQMNGDPTGGTMSWISPPLPMTLTFSSAVSRPLMERVRNARTTLKAASGAITSSCSIGPTLTRGSRSPCFRFATPGRNYGVISGVNWDGNEFFGKVILSTSDLPGLRRQGSILIEKAASSMLSGIGSSF